MWMRLLSFVAAATAIALLCGPASAQSYRGYSRVGSYVPGNFGMTRVTGYSASNFGMMRANAFGPTNFGNPGANNPYGAYAGATPGTPVPVGSLSSLPGVPFGPAMFPSSVSSFPAGTPQGVTGNQATLPGGVPQPAVGNLATQPNVPAEQIPGAEAPFPGGAPQPPPGSEGAFPGGAPVPPAATSALGNALTTPQTTPGVGVGVNTPAPRTAFNPTGATLPPVTTQTSYLGYTSSRPVYGTGYTTGQYPSSFSSVLGRVYGSAGY
jgi:hypothetical protein